MTDPAPYHAELSGTEPADVSVWLRADDGVRLRAALWRAKADAENIGTVLLFTGRTEYVEKYGRTARSLTALGLNVISLDWRGQGLSDRLLDDPLIGHVDRFSDFQRDVAALADWARALDLPQPWFLLAHSMGGAIGLRALLNGLPVRAAAFSGPMWGIRIAPLLRPIAHGLARASSLLGIAQRIAPGSDAAPYLLSAPFEDNTLTRDIDSFEQMRAQITALPELQLAGPSLQWLNGALRECANLAAEESPPQPCLTFVGDNERIVDTQRIRDRMAAWPNGELSIVPKAEHEVLMEGPDRRAALASRLATFYKSHGS